MKLQKIIDTYANDRYAFEQCCKKYFKAAQKQVKNYYDVFDPFCEKIDKKFLNIGETAAYVRVLWGTDSENPAELADELLDIAKRYNVIQYCVFYGDNDEDIILVAVYQSK